MRKLKFFVLFKVNIQHNSEPKTGKNQPGIQFLILEPKQLNIVKLQFAHKLHNGQCCKMLQFNANASTIDQKKKNPIDTAFCWQALDFQSTISF